jgi:predicted patatin/cPLA2 family phospholipase
MKGSMRNVGKADIHLVKSRKKPDEQNYEKKREEKTIRQLAEEFQKLVRLVLSRESCPEEDIDQQIRRFDDAVSAVTQRSIDYDRALAR